ncbi:MAG: hypothetical protein JNK64_42075 [Myxococcales bacterium]|nr:hypothetical protein [Myxococcales bacterium]
MFGLADILYRQIRAGEEEANRVYEPVIGVVTSIDDPSKLCRVRVQFPSLSTTDDAWWATVVSPGAGKDRGWFSLPEVGDEVLCVFEHGEIHRPVIIGQLWNGKDKAIDKNDGANERRVITSKSGSKLILDDKEQELTISDGGGIGSIKMSKDGVTFTSKQGDVALQAKGDLDIYAGEIQIKGTTVDLMGKSTGVDGTAAAALKINGNIVALKGATIDINPGGVPKAAKCSGEVSGDGENPGAGGGTAGGGSGSGSGSGGGGGSGSGGSGGGGGNGSGGPSGGGTSPGSNGGAGGGSGTDAPQNQPVEERPPLDVHQIEIKVINALDQPAVGVFYQLVQPDGRTRTGTTDGDGMIKIDDIEKPGDCQLTFPDVDQQVPEGDKPPPASAPPSSTTTAT